MRYYAISITGGAAGAKTMTYTSLGTNGATLPGALNVELDLPVTAFATPMGGAFIQIWGVSLKDISQATNLNPSATAPGAYVEVYGGMAKGLPLANPQQAGLLVAGTVQQAFGNWVGTDQTLTLIIQPGQPNTGTPFQPANLVLAWHTGTTLQVALQNTLSTAFPGYKQIININENLVVPNDEFGFFYTLGELSQYLNQITRDIIGGSYQGVNILMKDKTITVYDGSIQTKPKMINFNDLIGQPTWIGPGQLNMKCVMRADLQVGDYIKLPRGQIVTTAQSLSQYRQGSVFTGVFQIGSSNGGIRHLGNFRQPDAASWVTVIDAYGPVT